MSDWPHAPVHKIDEKGTYMVTCGIYKKHHLLHDHQRLNLFMDKFFDLAQEFNWKLQAWAILSNHYHFIAVSPEAPETLRAFLHKLHSQTARALNQLDSTPGRRVWFQYFDTRITYQRSYLARLKYIHHNPVHHGIVKNASEYRWCSACWFEQNANTAFKKTVESFKTDTLKVNDEY